MLRPSLTIAALLLVPFLGNCSCENDPLNNTGGFKPSECVNDQSCENGGRIDAGLNNPPDSGELAVDSGVDPNADTGVGPAVDAGVVDPPDSGAEPPDSGIPTDAGTIDDFLNLAGTHDTQYLFDWSAYLFGIANIAGPLDTIAQIVSGNISTGFPPLDALIRAAVQRFVPPWLITVINVLNGIANFFEEVEVTGVMNLSQSLPVPGPTGGLVCNLNGSETWTTLTVHLINLCPQGRQTPGFPACARQQIAIVPRGPTPVGPLEVQVDVHDFIGVLQPGVPQADFLLDNRVVEMDLCKLVRIAIDLAINLGTNGQLPSLAAALNQIIDCPGLQQEAYNIATGFGLNSALATAAAASVRVICDQEKTNAINAVVNGLDGICLGIVEFDYDQLGHAVDTNGNKRPETLQLMSTPHTIDGKFSLILSDPLLGEWAGQNRSP